VSESRDAGRKRPGGIRAFAHAFVRHRTAMTGAVVTCVVVAVAVVGPWLAAADPYSMNLRHILEPPGGAFPFGTDDTGRDVFSRVMHGTRLSLAVGGAVLLTTSILGTLVGLLSGYYRRLDGVVMRLVDALMAFPAIMLALVVVAILGPRTENVVLALTLVYLPRVARLVRGTVLAVREFEYVAAGVALGASSVRIIARYLLPNVIAPLIVQATFIYGYAILGEASLSFLGVGTSPPTPSLGNILSDARPMLREAPWLALFPAATIALTIFGFNLLGDGLRDVLDPRTTGRRS
jgi:peptide/nickel transport system permease protein